MFHDVLDSPSEIHHLRGKTIPDAHLLTICLCHRHHRAADPGEAKKWVSRHGDGRTAFENAYTTEEILLVRQNEKIEELKNNYV